MKNPIRVSFVRATRIALAAAIVVAFGVCAGAASAGAATGCAGLQAALDAAGSNGTTVVLDGMCTGSYTLPAELDIHARRRPGHDLGLRRYRRHQSSARELRFHRSECDDPQPPHLPARGPDRRERPLDPRLARHAERRQLLDNEEHGETAHAAFISVAQRCPVLPAGTPAITLNGSTFSKKQAGPRGQQGGGAGAWLEDACNAGSVLEDNVFEGNLLEASGTPTEVVVSGAGLQFVGPSNTRPEPVVSQRGNVFDSDNIIASAPSEADYGGGGEWLEYASLRSVNDRFSRDSVPGTAPAANSHAYAWSWGGGLGVWTPEGKCDATTYPHPESTLEDAIVEGNSIGPGTEADIGGGGIYVGCSHLNVFDSTFTLNTAYNGAGIEGEPGDGLVLANSIVAEDSPGNETGGFVESEGGSVTSSFSDICAYAGSSEPLPGTGNICANPLLANNGEPASFDVHETASSPTIDAGSNALVPSGLTTDAFGTTRILAGHAGCAGNFPAVVDMGAAEFQPAQPPCPAPVPEQSSTAASAVQPQALAPGLTHFVSLELSSTGIALRLSCSSADGRRCSGSIFVTSNEILRGKKIVAVGAGKRTKAPVRIGQATFSLAAGSTATIHVKLNSTGLRLLRRFHAFSAWVLADEAMPNNSQSIFFLKSVRFGAPNETRKAKRPGS